MAVHFFSVYRKFIRKMNPHSLPHCLTDIQDWFIIQHPLGGCKYPWGAFVPPSVQLPDKLSLCVTCGGSTSRFSALAKAKGLFLHLLGIPDVPTFLLLGQVGGPLLCIHKHKHTCPWSLIFQVAPKQQEQRSSARSQRWACLLSGFLCVGSPHATDFVFSVLQHQTSFQFPCMQLTQVFLRPEFRKDLGSTHFIVPL